MENFAKNLFNNIKADNIRLKSMIEEKILNLIVLGDANENSDYKLIWDVLDCYRNYVSPDFYVYIYNSKLENNEILNKIIHYYNLDKFVSFINNDNIKDTFTTFLGSDIAILLNDVKDEDLSLVEYFMLPSIVTNKELVKCNNKFLYIEDNPEDIASALSILNLNIDYRRKLVLGND